MNAEPPAPESRFKRRFHLAVGLIVLTAGYSATLLAIRYLLL